MVLDPRQHGAEPFDVEEARGRLLARGAQEDVVGLMAAQHVVDEVGRDRHLPLILLLGRRPALDQSGDDGALPEHAFHQRRFGKPGFEIIAQHVLAEQLRERQSALANGQSRIAEPHTVSAYSLATKPSGRRRARSSRRVSSMPSVWWASLPSNG